MKKNYRGSCHCGAVRFECELDLAAGTTRCNCTFCRKARFWMALVNVKALRVLQGADMLTDYQHAPPKTGVPFLHLTFCSRCGIRPFTKGGAMPPSGEEFYAVNLASLDDVDDAELAKARIHFADGRNDDWEKTPAEHAYL